MASRRNARAEPLRLMRSLNLFGLDFLDPIVLAALLDERPLLLIGPHGTAKSELLNRLAAALGLAHRHYNASVINTDDLIGCTVPEPHAAVARYLRAAGDVWDAESTFLDKIMRCRPEGSLTRPEQACVPTVPLRADAGASTLAAGVRIALGKLDICDERSKEWSRGSSDEARLVA
jgi:hypothetical protein